MVAEYTETIKAELLDKKAQKVGITMGDLRLYECPLSYITEDTWQMMRLVFLSEGSSQLYFSGGWADQPHWLIEALETYRAETARRSASNGGRTDRDNNIGGR